MLTHLIFVLTFSAIGSLAYNTYRCSDYNNIPYKLDYEIANKKFETEMWSQAGNYVVLDEGATDIIYAVEFAFNTLSYPSSWVNYTNTEGYELPITLDLYVGIPGVNPVTTGPIAATTGSRTSGLITTQALTTNALTTSEATAVVTTSPVTTARQTTGAISTGAISTGGFVYVTLGDLLYHNTTTFLIPWRPEPSSDCNGTQWKDLNGDCIDGLSFTILFEISGGLNISNDVVFILGYNTQTYGLEPYGVDGPYNTLGLGVSATAPDFGSNGMPGFMFINVTDILSQDSSAYPDYPMARFINGTCYEAPTPVIHDRANNPLIISVFVIIPVLLLIVGFGSISVMNGRGYQKLN
jgi:hypothetical protein